MSVEDRRSIIAQYRAREANSRVTVAPPETADQKIDHEKYQVVHNGEKIILPDGLSTVNAIEILYRKQYPLTWKIRRWFRNSSLGKKIYPKWPE